MDSNCEPEMPYSLIILFASMLVFCEISDPNNLWETFKDQMSDAVKYKLKLQNRTDVNNKKIYNTTLFQINKRLEIHNKTLDDYNL